MQNYIQAGNVLTCIAPSGGVTAGVLYVVGSFFGVAATSALEGEEYELQLGGVFEFGKVSAQAWMQGAAIYWDAAAKLATTASSGNTKIGVATLAAANPSGIGRVRLNGSF